MYDNFSVNQWISSCYEMFFMKIANFFGIILISRGHVTSTRPSVGWARTIVLRRLHCTILLKFLKDEQPMVGDCVRPLRGLPFGGKEC